MRISARILSVVAASALVLGATTPSADAQQTQLSSDARKCLEKIASASGKFVKKKLKAKQKCIEKDLKAPGDCDQVDLTSLSKSLLARISSPADRTTTVTSTNPVPMMRQPAAPLGH